MNCRQNKIRVALVDDHPLVLQGLAGLLRDEGFEVAGIAQKTTEALDLLAHSPSDLVVVDLTLEETSGFDLLLTIRKRHPTVTAVVYSVHEDVLHVRRALQSGAMGYVTKREDPEVLLQCLQSVYAGERFISPRATRTLADALAQGAAKTPELLLSRQEMLVYELLGCGFSTPDIATRMGISSRTVETYYSRILVKLNIAGRRELRLHASEYAKDSVSK